MQTNLNSLIKVSENPLNMSKEEEEESEEVESENESDENSENNNNPEEEEEDEDDIVEFDFEPQITDNANAIQNNNLEGGANANNLSPIPNSSPQAKGNNALNAANLMFTSNINTQNQTEEAKRYTSMFQKQVKKNFENVFLKPQKNKNKISSLSGHSAFSGHPQKKSVFTKAAEEAFKKAIKSKTKISCYDDLTNDLYLRKVMEKNDTQSNLKMNAFLERTRDYHNKRSVRLNQMTQEASKKNLSVNTGKAHTRTNTGTVRNFNANKSASDFKKEGISIRSPEKYMEDQMKFLENRENHLNNQREIKKLENDKNIKNRPEISKKSQSLAKKKVGEFAKDIHTRLYEENSQKKKVDLLKSAETKDVEKKLTEKEVSVLVEKLFNDAKERKQRQISYEKIDHMMIIDPHLRSSSNSFSLRRSLRHFNEESQNSSFNSGDYALTTNSSKFVILKKFIKEFDLVMVNINRNREGMNFDDYCDLLYNIGFLNFDHRKAKLMIIGAVNNSTIEQNNIQAESSEDGVEENLKVKTNTLNNNYDIGFNTDVYKKTDNLIYDEQTLKRLDKELLLIKDSWRILTKKKNIEGSEKLEVDQILLFCVTVLGLYKGCSPEERNVNTVEERKDEAVSPENEGVNQENKTTNSILKDIQETPLQETPFTPVKNNDIEKSNSNASPTSQISPIRKSVISSAISFYASGRTSSMFRTPTIEQKDNLLRLVLPKFDTSKYFYEPKIVKQLKVFFKTFYENRVNFLGNKKTEKVRTRADSHCINPDMTFKPNISHRSKFSGYDIQSKWIEKAKEIDKNEDGVERKLRMSEVYEILRKKKENDLALQRKLKEDNEMTECTFIPNLFRNNKFNSNSEINDKLRSKSLEVTKRLYSHAMNKLLRIKSIYEEQKAVDVSFEKDSKECTFSPKTTNLKGQIFQVNPLENDSLVKTELERYEKARIEKKLKELIISRGINSLNKIKNIDDLLHGYKLNEDLPQFRFDNEMGKNKDSFDRFSKFAGKTGKKSTFSNKDNYISEEEMSARKQKSSSITPVSPLFTMTIELEEGNKEKVNFYPNDDPILVAEKFSMKHNLSPEKKNNLKSVIEMKLNELI